MDSLLIHILILVKEYIRITISWLHSVVKRSSLSRPFFVGWLHMVFPNFPNFTRRGALMRRCPRGQAWFLFETFF